MQGMIDGGFRPIVRAFHARSIPVCTRICLGVLSFMLLNACFRWVALPPWDGVLQKYVPRTAQGPLELIHQGFADQITIYIAIVVAAHAYQYFERLRKEEMEKHDFQRALAASELQALKMQLHPHFLFDKLHGISTLIDTDRASAKARVFRLSASCVTHDEASFTFSEGEDHTATATIVLPALSSDSKGSADPPLLVETIEGNHARVDRGR